MQTQINVTVKNEFILNKFFTLSWIVQIFKKSRMILWLDGEQHILKASKQPYSFDVAPGVHELVFTDYLEPAKNRFWKLTFGFIGMCFGLGAGGSSYETVLGASMGLKAGEVSKKSHIVNINVNDGDILNMVCKTKSRSKVKVWNI